MRGLFRLLGILTVALVCHGCGYSFRAAGEPLGGPINSLAIPLITSTSSQLGFETVFTNIIRETFISQTTVSLLPTEEAEMALIGQVYEITNDPVAFEPREVTIGGRTATYSVTSSRQLLVKLDIKCVERASGTIIWQERTMIEKANYDLGPDPLVNDYNARKALELIARLLANRIYLKTIERF